MRNKFWGLDTGFQSRYNRLQKIKKGGDAFKFEFSRQTPKVHIPLEKEIYYMKQKNAQKRKTNGCAENSCASPKRRELLYVEPIDYFPKSIRKKYKMGEYAEKSENDE